MISRSCVCSQGSVDAVLADHFLPGPCSSSLLRWVNKRPGPVSNVWSPCEGSRDGKYIALLQKISSSGNIIYFLATVIENLLNQIDRDLLWLCLAFTGLAGWRLGLAARPQLLLSRAGSCQLSSPGAGSCHCDSLCQIKWSSLSIRQSQCILWSVLLRGPSAAEAERTFAENCCSITAIAGSIVTRPRVLPSETCFAAKSVNGGHHHLSCPRLCPACLG